MALALVIGVLVAGSAIFAKNHPRALAAARSHPIASDLVGRTTVRGDRPACMPQLGRNWMRGDAVKMSQ